MTASESIPECDCDPCMLCGASYVKDLYTLGCEAIDKYGFCPFKGFSEENRE